MSVRAKFAQINALFRAALAGGYEGKKPWIAVKDLRNRGNRIIFEKAAVWCVSQNPHKRARGADILCQLRGRLTSEQRSSPGFKSASLLFSHESFEILTRLITTEKEEQPLTSALYGLGHLYLPAAVPLLTTFANHASGNVRHAVAWSLGCFHNEPASVETLILLTSDTDAHVRDWATFAIGTQSDADSPELREALYRRLSDKSPKVREEAMGGLAKRKDNRAVLPLFKLMRAGSYPLHLESDFEILVEEERGRDYSWGTEDFIDALYVKFPELLPARIPVA